MDCQLAFLEYLSVKNLALMSSESHGPQKRHTFKHLHDSSKGKHPFYIDIRYVISCFYHLKHSKRDQAIQIFFFKGKSTFFGMELKNKNPKNLIHRAKILEHNIQKREQLPQKEIVLKIIFLFGFLSYYSIKFS